jgi:hypothetical protein
MSTLMTRVFAFLTVLCAMFLPWIESDEIAPTDADSPSPCHRIGLALIRLAYEVAEKVKPQK